MILLLVVLIVLLFAGIPSFPAGYNRSGAYGVVPSGIIGILVIILIVWLISGRGR